MRLRTPLGLPLAAIIASLLGLGLVAVFIGGPLHATYEQLCEQYPPLRVIGPVPFAVFLTAGLAAATLALGSLIAGAIRSVALSGRIEAGQIETPPRVHAEASALGVPGRVVCIEGPQPLAFCYGLFRPMICVSKALVDRLDANELRAVLAHEAEHLRARDPLRLLIGRAMARAAFMVPAAGETFRRYVLQRELQADDGCMATCQRESLASALFKLITQRAVNPTGVAGFNLLEERITHLTEPDTIGDFKLPWTKVTGQAMALVGVVLLGLGALGGTAEAAVVGCLL